MACSAAVWSSTAAWAVYGSRSDAESVTARSLVTVCLFIYSLPFDRFPQFLCRPQGFLLTDPAATGASPWVFRICHVSIIALLQIPVNFFAFGIFSITVQPSGLRLHPLRGTPPTNLNWHKKRTAAPISSGAAALFSCLSFTGPRHPAAICPCPFGRPPPRMRGAQMMIQIMPPLLSLTIFCMVSCSFT